MRLPRHRKLSYGWLPLILWTALIIAITCAISGCALTSPITAATTPDNKAYALYGEFVIFEEQAAALKQSGTLPVSAARTLTTADARAKPTADALAQAVRDYLSANAALKAGSGTAAQVQIAATQLTHWTQQADTDLGALITAVKGAHP